MSVLVKEDAQPHADAQLGLGCGQNEQIGAMMVVASRAKNIRFITFLLSLFTHLPFISFNLDSVSLKM
jgi:hypothetical protein